MELSDIKERRLRAGKKRITPQYFSGAEILTLDGFKKGFDDYGIFLDAKPTDIGSPLDVSIVGENDDDPGGFSVQRYRQIKPSEVRGRLRRIPRYLIETTLMIVSGEGEAGVFSTLQGSGGPHGWQGLAGCEQHNSYLDEVWAEKIQISYGLAFTRQFFWNVQLGWEGNAMIRIPTDPMGAREVFKLRDIPEGRVRRAAIRDWITDHWRQRRQDPSTEVYVRKHLRGAQQFSWGGLNCYVTPSDYDINREQKLIREREELREAGEDIREKEMAHATG
jgi:hypothetical protein